MARRYLAQLEAASPAQGLATSIPIPRSTRIRWMPSGMRRVRWCSPPTSSMRGECEQRVLRGASAGTPCAARRAMGFCVFNSVAIGVHACARRARPRTRRRRRLRRPPRQWHRGDLRRRPSRADGVDVPVPAVSVFGCRAAGPQHAQRAVARRRWRRRISAPRSPMSGCPRWRNFAPQAIYISAGFDAHREDPLAGLNFTEADYAWVTRELMGVAARTRRAGSSRRSKAATRCRRSAAAPPSTCASCSRTARRERRRLRAPMVDSGCRPARRRAALRSQFPGVFQGKPVLATARTVASARLPAD